VWREASNSWHDSNEHTKKGKIHAEGYYSHNTGIRTLALFAISALCSEWTPTQTGPCITPHLKKKERETKATTAPHKGYLVFGNRPRVFAKSPHVNGSAASRVKIDAMHLKCTTGSNNSTSAAKLLAHLLFSKLENLLQPQGISPGS